MIRLASGESAICGYGSLLSMQSLERTLGRSYNGPFLQCNIKGWRRTWDAAMPNQKFYAETDQGRLYPETILYLNVQRDPAVRLNGILFVVDSEELARYDEREWIYERVAITDQLDLEITGGSAYVYVCRPEYCKDTVESTREGAIRRTYIEIVENGLTNLGTEFRAAYRRSTDPVPQNLVIADKLDT